MLLLQITINLNLFKLEEKIFVLVSMIFIGIVFSGVGLFLATKVRNGQTFQIVKTAVTMPLTFLSGAYFPLSMLPDSLRFVAYVNPMTYATAFFRMIVLKITYLSVPDLIKEGLVVEINGFAITPFMTFAVILVIGLVFLLLSTISFVKTDFSRLNRSATDASVLWG